MYGLWRHYQKTSLSLVNDLANGINASTIVVTLVEGVFYKLVVLDVMLHLPATDKVEVNTIILVHILLTGCIWQYKINVMVIIFMKKTYQIIF